MGGTLGWKAGEGKENCGWSVKQSLKIEKKIRKDMKIDININIPKAVDSITILKHQSVLLVAYDLSSHGSLPCLLVSGMNSLL